MQRQVARARHPILHLHRHRHRLAARRHGHRAAGRYVRHARHGHLRVVGARRGRVGPVGGVADGHRRALIHREIHAVAPGLRQLDPARRGVAATVHRQGLAADRGIPRRLGLQVAVGHASHQVERRHTVRASRHRLAACRHRRAGDNLLRGRPRLHHRHPHLVQRQVARAHISSRIHRHRHRYRVAVRLHGHRPVRRHRHVRQRHAPIPIRIGLRVRLPVGIHKGYRSTAVYRHLHILQRLLFQHAAGRVCETSKIHSQQGNGSTKVSSRRNLYVRVVRGNASITRIVEQTQGCVSIWVCHRRLRSHGHRCPL